MHVPSILTLAAFVLTMLGACIGMMGSLEMARAYHAFTFLDFARHVVRVAWRYIREPARARQIVAATVAIAEVNPEKRDRSLVGLYLVFCGFALQLSGGILAFVGSLLSAR